MKSINFDEGKTEYKVCGDENRIIRINLGDFNLMDRLKGAESGMRQIIEKYEKEDSTVEDIVAADKELRAFFNEVFDTDVCTPAFGGANCFTRIKGKWLFERFFESFLPIVTEDITSYLQQEQEQLNPKVEQYVAPIVTRSEPPALQVDSLTPEQKNDLLRQLLGNV